MTTRTELARLLKTAAAFSRMSTRELSVAARISKGRITRFNTGAAIPTEHEAQTMLLATGVDLTYLTAGIQRADARETIVRVAGFDAARLLLCLLKSQHPPQPKNLQAASIPLLIDKLSFTFNVSHEGRFKRAAANLFPATKWQSCRSPSRLYERSASHCGVRLDLVPSEKAKSGDRNPRFARLEINPANPETSWVLVQRVVPFVDLLSSRITRIDLAVDLPIWIGEVFVLATGKRKVCSVLGTGGLETWYLGAEEAEHRVKVYDKAGERERRVGKRLPPPEPLTRFEVQVRQPGLGLSDLHQLPDPFTKLRLLPLRSTGLPLPERLLVEHARFFGLLPVMAELGKSGIAALESVLARSEAAPVLPHPRDIFAAQWPAACADLLMRMGVVR